MSSTAALLKAAPINGPFSLNSAEDLDALSRSPKRPIPNTTSSVSRPALPSLKFCDADKSQEESHSELEVFTSASGDEDSDVEVETPPAQSRDVPEVVEKRYTARKIPEREEKRSVWTDLDLSMVVALVSPIGNWLTGGDHIKNLLLIALLIFYLHQLVQIPWDLYCASRPRRPYSSHPVSESNTHLLNLARSELQSLEFAFLAFVVISPLIGAGFLRYVLSAITGTDPLSWFSTTLFVLATGIRPWTHLIERLRERTRDLHDAVHYPDPESPGVRLQILLERVEQLEREIRIVSDRARQAEGIDEVYDDLSGAVEDVEKHLRRTQKKAEAARVAQESRLALLEKGLGLLLDERQQNKHRLSARPQHAQSFLLSVLSVLSYVPQSLWSLFVLESSPPRRARPEIATVGPRSSFAPSPSTSPVLTPTRLETILEDSDSGDEEVTPRGKASTSIPLKNFRSKRVSPKSPISPARSAPAPASPRSQSQSLVDYAAAAVTWPYRMSVKLLTLPLQKLLA